MKKIIVLMTLPLLISACKGSEEENVAQGVFEATEVIVSAETAGTIRSFSVDEGQEVKKGDAVVVIDDAQLLIQRSQLEAQKTQILSQQDVTLAGQQSTIAQQEATLAQTPDIAVQEAAIEQQMANLRNEKARTERLLAAGAATQRQLDEINYQLSVLDKQLGALRSNLVKQTESIKKQAKSVGGQVATADKQAASIRKQAEVIDPQIALVDDMIAKCSIVSPISGTILTKYAEAGEYTAPGKPLFKVADVGHLYLRAYITAPQLTTLKLGQKVRVFADQGESDRREYEGTVAWISDKAEFTPKTIQTRDERANLVYAVKIAVKNDGMIKIGMYGEVGGFNK